MTCFAMDAPRSAMADSTVRVCEWRERKREWRWSSIVHHRRWCMVVNGVKMERARSEVERELLFESE
ncbi:hypothetical protein CsSME_00011798 [Camellia sinensis var. sinensis]